MVSHLRIQNMGNFQTFRGHLGDSPPKKDIWERSNPIKTNLWERSNPNKKVLRAKQAFAGTRLRQDYDVACWIPAFRRR
jgi:hypothetical protein